MTKIANEKPITAKRNAKHAQMPKSQRPLHPQEKRDIAEAKLLRKRLNVLKHDEELYLPTEYKRLYPQPFDVCSLKNLVASLRKIDRIGRETAGGKRS